MSPRTDPQKPQTDTTSRILYAYNVIYLAQEMFLMCLTLPSLVYEISVSQDSLDGDYVERKRNTCRYILWG